VRTPAPLRRLDEAALTVWRHLASPLVRPAVGLSRWERERAPAAIRTLVTRPGLVAVLAGSLVVTAASVHVVRYPDRVEADVVAAPPVPEVGPVPGVDLAAYTDARHELLAQLEDDEVVRAIVSFHEFATVGQLPVPGEVRVERLHVGLPGEVEPRVVPAEGARATLRTLFAAGQDELDEQIGELERLLAEDLGDPAFEREFAAELARLQQLRASASDDAPVVFAAVMVATAADLRDLAAAPDVRLVDVAGPPERTRDTRLVGVPPADTARASTERGVASEPAP
jgi:hypothetical protein